MSKVQITIQANQGYNINETRGVTVAELIEMLQEFDGDMEIATYNDHNPLGACFGGIMAEIEQVQDDSEQDDNRPKDLLEKGADFESGMTREEQIAETL